MKFRLAAATAATGIAASALLSVLPAAAQDAPVPQTLPLTMSPTSAGVEEPVTLTGTGCTFDGSPGAIQTFADGEPLSDYDPQNPEVANADGTWETGFVVAAGSTPGDIEITVTCSVNDGSGTVIAEYGPETFTLTADTPATTAPDDTPPATVDPATVAPAATPIVADPDFTG